MDNYIGSFQLYPRGFLGAVLQPSIKLQPPKGTQGASRLTYNATLFDPAQSPRLSGNSTVDELWKAHYQKRQDAHTFEFHSKVFKAAKNAFGTTSFFEWYVAQLSSPVMGDLHRRFLDDTLRFIATGRRELSIYSWRDLITGSKDIDVDNHITPLAKEFFDLKQNRANNHIWTLDVIAQWLSHYEGYEDMLLSLKILFGSD